MEDFQMDVSELELSFEPGMAGQIMPKLKLPSALKAKPTAMLQADFRASHGDLPQPESLR